MRRLLLPRRRKRNRLVRFAEKTWLTIVAVLWIVRLFARRGRLVLR